ncbi:MAG: hypothetical protein V3S83_02200 [Gemmatimonadota bacterium]
MRSDTKIFPLWNCGAHVQVAELQPWRERGRQAVERLTDEPRT